MADMIDVTGLTSEQVRTLERLVQLFRKGPHGESGEAAEAFRASAGAWKGLIDAEALKRDILADRRINTRPRVDL